MDVPRTSGTTRLRALPGRRTRTVRSLRSRWRRAFALLAAVVILSGTASVLAIQLIVDSFRGSAVAIEQETTSSADLRNEIVAGAVTFASPTTATQQAQQAAAVTAIDADYAADLLKMKSASARALLAASLVKWNALIATGGTPGHLTDYTTRGDAVAAQAPAVLSLLDQAGAANRADVRVDLARASQLDREGLTALIVLEFLAIALALRLAHQLSNEVLRPVGILRDSANRLARGEVDHRVVVGRPDELGELAVSFNAMADAIAGSQRTLTEEANTDSLSGLANRAAFYVKLAAMLAEPDRQQQWQALLFIDLDDFKDVNDTLGHAAGDELLRVVAERLRAVVRPTDLVARLGGDEFALLLDDLDDSADAMTLAQRVVVTLAQPVHIGARAVHVGASVGLALRHRDSGIEGWVREADTAMYAAKARGKNRVEQYDARLDDAAVAHQLLKDEVAVAAARDELVVEYQPVVELNTGELVGLEALVRWQHPTRGLLPPSSFIELAEETGAILSIGAWVLEQAAHQLRSWQRRYGREALWMSVNVSVCQLEAPNYATTIGSILRAADVDPSGIVVEVTESVLADPDGGATEVLTTLRAAGVRIALDDFGTGYSSVGYLRQLPVDFLKIDRSFVAGTSPDTRNPLLEGIIGLARHLGLQIIPEGIEQPAELAQLRALGCHLGQGFLMSRPVAPEAIESLLAAPIPFPHVEFAATTTSPYVDADEAARAIRRS
jgi:diguanylate cyclase (GGDEF)-like protein